MPSYPRALHQPPTGRPHWINEASPDHPIQYLAWGSRAYGRQPIPISEHAGWTYQLITQGEATLQVSGQTRLLRAGRLALIGPGCPYGWRARKKTSRCRILTWIWSEAPIFPDLQPAAHDWKSLRLSEGQIKELAHLHRATRLEVSSPDPATPHALQSLKLRLDVLLVRSSARPAASTTPAARLHLAQTWIKEHPDILNPVSSLCDLLGISAASLNRLFRQHLQKNVREIACTHRLTLARSALQETSLSIKEIALRFGYRHAHDFTRAYTRHWQEPPSLTRSSH